MARLTDDIMEQVVQKILEGEEIRSIRSWLNCELKFSNSQMNSIIPKAKDIIRERMEETNDIQKELNIYRLNNIAKTGANQDRLKAIDLLNKMGQYYVQKIELSRDVKFILGEEGDEWMPQENITKKIKADGTIA